MDGSEDYKIVIRLREGDLCALLKDSADVTILKVARDHSDMRYVATDNPEVKLQLLSMLGEMSTWLDAQMSTDANPEEAKASQQNVNDAGEISSSTLRSKVYGSALIFSAAYSVVYMLMRKP